MSFRPSLEKLSTGRSQEDAWSSSFRPPSNETPQEKKDRIARQQDAARISKEIDDTIEKSKKVLEKRNKAIKVLLLGQAESGKSTMLRNFQLAFCPNYFQNEASIWKTIIQLNIIGSVKKLLSIIEDELESQGSRALASSSCSRVSPPTHVHGTTVRARSITVTTATSDDSLAHAVTGVGRRANETVSSSDVSSGGTTTSSTSTGLGARRPSTSVSNGTTLATSRIDVSASTSNPRLGTFPSSNNPISHSASALDGQPDPNPTSPSKTQDNQDPPLTSHHAALRLRLLPLLSIETNLNRQLLPDSAGPGAPPARHKMSSGWAKWASGGSGGGSADFSATFGSIPGLGCDSGEVCVRAGGEWKSVLAKVSSVDGRDVPSFKQQQWSQSGRQQPSVDALPNNLHHRPTRPHPSDPTPLLHALTQDIHALWIDPAVQALLRRRGVRMEQSAGFFLNDVSRIGKSDWTPAFEDIVRARVRTFGVEEHRFSTDSAGTEWYIYDVGGSRSMRHQWVPYFDDVQAIIFLVPLVFNQVLDEDRMINRLEDSVHLWKQVCSNRLLERANIILFFNKMDILEATLKAGVRVETYVPSYGDLPNEVDNVVRYFKDKFRGYHKRLSPKPRTFFCHETSAVDIKATQAVLIGVREGILRRHLEDLKVI